MEKSIAFRIELHPIRVASHRHCDPANIFNPVIAEDYQNTSMKTYRFLIKGRAQGVFYRKTIQEQAQAREIRGSIKNLPDGSVKVLAALTEEQLPSFLDLLKKGSPNSQVESISKAVIDGADLEYDSFIVRY